MDVIILAAGRGRRMGLTEHKALVPAITGQGTLERLLRQLSGLQVGAVTVVTGHRRASVAATVRKWLPRARCVHNPLFETTEILQSLACAFARCAPRHDCWVLMADTVYADAALAALFSAPPGGVAVAVTVRSPGDGTEIAVSVRDGAVVALAGDAARGGWRMAHAVRWPVALQRRLCAASADGLRFQWQLVAELLKEQPAGSFTARAVMLPLGSACDLDTADDLTRARSMVLL